MSAVLLKTLTDVRRRKLQTLIVAGVVFLSSLTGTLALTLLVESDAPFDRALEQTQGAHLYVAFDSARITESQVQATQSLAPISAANGPWRVVPATITIAGGRTRVIPVAGRSQAGGVVDRLSIDSGRWVQRDGEVVVSRDLADENRLQIGDSLVAGSDSTLPPLRVVGIAVSLGGDAAAWIEPTQIPSIVSAKLPPATYLMAYRLHRFSTAVDIAAAVDAITKIVPADAIVGSTNFLDRKLNADRTTAVMIPFLLAFSLFALIASALIIAILVGGTVAAGVREIGVMKAIGFTPGQVVASFAGQMLLPGAVGCALGLPTGVLLSQPFLSDTAHAFGLPRTFGLAPGQDSLGIGVILSVLTTTAVLASLRAGRLSAAAAIAAGSAPAAGGRSKLARYAGTVPLPRFLTLGLGESLAKPLRAAMTAAAIVIGVATVTFALGLHESLDLVSGSITRAHQVQIEVFRKGLGQDATAELSDQAAASLIANQPGTARFVSVGRADAAVPGAGETVPVTAYREDSSWLGFALIHGRWFTAPGEAVAPSAFYARTGHHVGDAITMTVFGRPVTLTLVGEIFDQQGDNILLRTCFGSLPAQLVAWNYEIQLRTGTDPVRYASALETEAQGLSAQVNGTRGIDTAFLLINSVLAGLALVLGLIAVSGVFNTVVLNTRDKARDIAILKALGMTPGQVVTMVLASVSVLAVLGAIGGIPVGIALHRYLLAVMGQIASGTGIPDAFFAVFDARVLAGLAGGAIVITLLGAMLPAQWAARSRITEVLQAE